MCGDGDGDGDGDSDIPNTIVAIRWENVWSWLLPKLWVAPSWALYIYYCRLILILILILIILPNNTMTPTKYHTTKKWSNRVEQQQQRSYHVITQIILVKPFYSHLAHLYTHTEYIW